jgi:LmbE family N-acetylglucosaminyl deacetylase
LAEKHIRLLDAHPDDSIQHAHAIEAAQHVGATVDEALLTLGTLGKNLRTNTDALFDVASGDRFFEEYAGMQMLGLKRLLPYQGTDGSLESQIDILVPAIAKDAIHDNVDVFLSSGNLWDHPDHQAAGAIAVRAALWAANEGYKIDVLQLHHFAGGSYFAPATASSILTAFLSAKEHESQWRFSEHELPGYVETPGELHMHKEDFDALLKYPLLRYATYSQVVMEHANTDATAGVRADAMAGV